MAQATIRTIWGLAKCSELSLNDDELHALVEGITGKESIKKLSKREIGLVVRKLQKMKDSATREGRRRRNITGNIATVNQRKKIYKLAQELGWEKQSRVNGMCKRMFGVSSVDWLNYIQCSKLIEALKKMVQRMEESDAENSKTHNRDGAIRTD